MSYKLREKKEGIKSYLVKDDQIAYINDSGILMNNELIVKGVNDLFTIHKGELIYVKNNSTHYQKKTINKSILVESLHDNIAIFSSDFKVENFTLKYEVIDLRDQTVLHDFGHQPLIRTVQSNSDQISIQFENRLISFCLNESKILWTIDRKVNKILGSHKNELLVADTNHSIISIDEKTGSILHRWNRLLGFQACSTYKDEIPNSENFIVDQENSKMIGVFHTFYFEIDLIGRQIEYYQLEQEFKKYGISDFRPFFKNPFTSDSFFLTTHTYLKEFPNVDLSSIIELNRKTRKIDWYYTFRESGLGTNTPMLSSKQIFQLDTEKTLHIFEQEN